MKKALRKARKGAKFRFFEEAGCLVSGGRPFKVGDAVQIKAAVDEAGPESMYIASVRGLSEAVNDAGELVDQLVAVEWYFLPEDMASGRLPQHGADELFQKVAPPAPAPGPSVRALTSGPRSPRPSTRRIPSTPSTDSASCCRTASTAGSRLAGARQARTSWRALRACAAVPGGRLTLPGAGAGRNSDVLRAAHAARAPGCAEAGASAIPAVAAQRMAPQDGAGFRAEQAQPQR